MLHSSKHPIARDMCHPLKTSWITEAFQIAAINIDTSIYFSDTLCHSISIEFWPVSKRIDYERLYIVVSPILIEDRGVVVKNLKEYLIPEITKWVLDLLKSPGNSPIRREKQRGTFSYAIN